MHHAERSAANWRQYRMCSTTLLVLLLVGYFSWFGLR